MKISDLRNITQMTQRQFAEYFGIPVGTLRNWEQGIANPPEYVFQMIITSIRRDKMINVETIKFVQMLDELAVLSKNGILPFENAKEAWLFEKGMGMERLSSIMKEAMEERKSGKVILLAQMNKNKKFQKDQLTKEGYTEFKEFYKEALRQ